MSVTAQWLDTEVPREVTEQEIAALWAEVERSEACPTVLVLRSREAEMHAIIGEERGTVLLYFPPNCRATGTGSLHSIGDAAAADRNNWEPPIVAYYFEHDCEFPKWMLVPTRQGQRALQAFCRHPDVPPAGIVWEQD